MAFARPVLPRGADPGEVIVDQRLRNLYRRFLGALLDFHDEITMEITRVEVRVFFGNVLLCRVVPYRELFHVQIGEENAWEIRVRHEAACLDTLDRALVRFLDVYAMREFARSPLT